LPTSGRSPLVTTTRTLEKSPLDLELRWSTTIPGEHAHVIAVDAGSRSVFVGDGSNVPRASLRLHRMDGTSGWEVASTRTRHQSVTALLPATGHLLTATDSRLLELDPGDLSLAHSWEKRLVRSSSQLVEQAAHIVEANWLTPHIGILDRSSGDVRRVHVGAQPIVFAHDGSVHAIAGLDGGLATVDVERARLSAFVATPPVSSVAVGRDIWAVVGGRIESPRTGGTPRTSRLPQYRRGTDEIVRLTGSRHSIRVGAPCRRLWCDDARGLLWCSVATDDSPHGDFRCLAVDQASGKLAGRFDTETPASVRRRDPLLGSVSRHLVHLDVHLGAAFITQVASRRQRGHDVIGSTSTLTCYSLPAVG
jgi:hypothetical protein